MQLLVFAHRGEAQAFLKTLSPKALGSDLYMSYFSEARKCYLLITGEGPWKAFEQVQMFLSDHKDVASVINLGIAAGLVEQAPFEAFTIRTAYMAYPFDDVADRPSLEFHSYTLNTLKNQKQVDCITCLDRIFSREKSDKLAPVADLADRELWGVARACSNYNIPLSSIKVVSDTPSKDREICQRVREESHLYSRRLFELWSETEKDEQVPLQTEKKKWPWQTNPHFHITVTTGHMLEELGSKYLHALQSANHLVSLEDLVKGLEKSDQQPKMRAAILVQTLQDLINPIHKKTRDRLEELTGELRAAGISVHFDKHYEKREFTLAGSIRSPEEIFLLIQKLKSLDTQGIFQTLDGEDHV